MRYLKKMQEKKKPWPLSQIKENKTKQEPIVNAEKQSRVCLCHNDDLNEDIAMVRNRERGEISTLQALEPRALIPGKQEKQGKSTVADIRLKHTFLTQSFNSLLCQLLRITRLGCQNIKYACWRFMGLLKMWCKLICVLAFKCMGKKCIRGSECKGPRTLMQFASIAAFSLHNILDKNDSARQRVSCSSGNDEPI